MTDKRKTAGSAKPYTKGTPTDENTIRNALIFFGVLVLSAFMCFIVCSMTSFKSVILRVLINAAIEALILIIFYAKGAEYGTDGVARGEILYQHIQKGQEVSAGERRIPFHPMKGFMIGILGTVIPLILALILAVSAEKQMTSAGALPSWMETYLRRSEIGDALTGYTQSISITVTDIVRIIVRIMIMPFVAMAGAENRDLLLLLERISPLIVFLPAASYGTGYLTGPAKRKMVHTEIAANNKKRISREKRARKARRNSAARTPEQLN